jgi:hypothetical protein
MNGTYCLSLPNWDIVEKTISGISEGWCFFLWNQNNNSSNKHIILLKNGSTTILELKFTSADEKIHAYIGGVDVGNTTMTFTSGQAYKIGLHFKIDDTVGRIEVTVDGGSDEIDYTGDTKPGADTTFDRIRLGNDYNYTNEKFDDFIMDDVEWPGGGPPAGPTPGQLMRHGTWFSGVKKPMEWAR